MKKTLASAILLCLSCAAFAEEVAKEAEQNSVLFSVNGQPVTQFMLQQLAQERMQPGMRLTPELQRLLMAEMSNLLVLSQAAAADKLEQTPRNQVALEMQRISLLAKMALEQRLTAIKISDAEVKALYDKNHAAPGKEYKARHILVKEQKEAEEIIAELNKGGNFAELAKKRSTDTTSGEGGDLGWFTQGTMVQPFNDAAIKLEKGKFTTAPVQTQFGWHVILLEDSREVPPTPFEQLKPRLQAELRQAALESYIKELRDKAEIKPAAGK